MCGIYAIFFLILIDSLVCKIINSVLSGDLNILLLLVEYIILCYVFFLNNVVMYIYFKQFAHDLH